MENLSSKHLNLTTKLRFFFVRYISFDTCFTLCVHNVDCAENGAPNMLQLLTFKTINATRPIIINYIISIHMKAPGGLTL